MKRYRDLTWSQQRDVRLSAYLGLMIVFFVVFYSCIFANDSTTRTDIPGTNCEVVETVNRNLWFTPGETTRTEKIVCTETTTIDKIDIEKLKKEAAK